MKLLAELFDQDIDPNLPINNVDYRLRRASRAVLTHNGKLALLHVSSDNYYKWPGGGVEEGENVKEALARELLEETGCNAEVTSELGLIIEYRSQYQLVQMSYVYIAEVVGEPGEPQFTESETKGGFSVVWVTLEEAKRFFESANPTEYGIKFMTARERKILEAYESAQG